MPKITFDFASIPGCVVWLQTSGDGVQNVLRERGIEGDVFVWEDPNHAEQGVVVAYSRTLTDAERKLVEIALLEGMNPPLGDLP